MLQADVTERSCDRLTDVVVGRAVEEVVVALMVLMALMARKVRQLQPNKLTMQLLINQ